MGVSRFSGPVYGSKGSLFSVGPVSASTGSSAVFAGTVVPAGEDWYATELLLYRNSTGSTNFIVSLQDDSTTIGQVSVNGSSIAVSNYSSFVTDGGEFEGTRIASGSVITLSHSSHAGPNANINVVVRGFTRFVNSSAHPE